MGINCEELTEKLAWLSIDSYVIQEGDDVVCYMVSNIDEMYASRYVDHFMVYESGVQTYGRVAVITLE